MDEAIEAAVERARGWSPEACETLWESPAKFVAGHEIQFRGRVIPAGSTVTVQVGPGFVYAFWREPNGLVRLWREECRS